MGTEKPSGVVRGECRGGLGGAAAPNRPPSAPAGGGPNNTKIKAAVPAGHRNHPSKDKPTLFFMKLPLRKYRCHYAPFSNSDMRFLRLPCSQRDASQLSFRTKPYAGIARRGGRSPSAARKLPKQMPRSPRGMAETGKPLEASPWERRYTTSPAGSSGGSAEGASEGRQPLTGPHLPPAAQAAQIKIKKGSRARRAQNPPLKGQAWFYSSKKFRQCELPHLPPAAQAAQTTENESRHARRAQNPPLKGQVRLYSS